MLLGRFAVWSLASCIPLCLSDKTINEIMDFNAVITLVRGGSYRKLQRKQNLSLEWYLPLKKHAFIAGRVGR